MFNYMFIDQVGDTTNEGTEENGGKGEKDGGDV